MTTPATAQELALANAVVLNPADESTQRGVLLIEGGRVTGVTDGVPPGFTGEIHDVGGRFVIPALADLHTHSFGNNSPAGMPQLLGPQGTANAALYNGVAFVLDLFSPEEMILGFRNRQRDDGGQGAVLFAAGPCFTATDGHCSEYGIPTRIVNTPEEARREVNDLAGSGPDVVKIVYDHQSYGGRSFPTVDLATLTAVLETAREHGFRTVVHVGTWQDVREAAEAGADAITHTPGPDPLPADLADFLVRAGTFHIPTLAVQSEFARMLDDPVLLDDPLLVETVPGVLLDAYRGTINPQLEGWLAWQRTLVEPNREAVRELAAAGVPMLTGTDGGNFGVFQGYSVHRELELLGEAGLSAWAALRSATTDAARFLGRRWGVEPGDEGTLLVLDASPVESIVNTKRIYAVIQRGSVIDRKSLRSWN
ncbi:MAG: amidohydrolase family protein [Gemmatimonadetes bacterium]|nr:amidohydrolase family protein [Gemmatimonadota bacterium]